MKEYSMSSIKTAVVSEGVRLAYVEQGAPQGIPVVLLHGFSDSHRSFDFLRPHLPSDWRVLAPTQRGHGDSSKPRGDYGIPDLARDVAAFLDAVEVDRAILVGHSMGEAVTLQAAADYPERVRAIALMGAFADFRANPCISELAEACAALSDPVDPNFAREFQESTLANPTPEGFLEMAIAESLKLPAFVWRDISRGFLEADLPDAARRAQAPALIVWGDRDAYCPRTDQSALSGALGAELVVMPGVGHAVHWERPAEVARGLVNFVAGLEQPPLAGAQSPGRRVLLGSVQ
jgi:pimeloyl-ACP methyl ester carboxylesterase